MKRLQAGESLMGVMIAMAVVAFAVVFFVTGGFGMMGGKKEGREDGLGKTLVGQARYAAEDRACKTQLEQVRQLVGLATDPVDETRPATLSEVAGLPTGYDRCPIDKQNYEYDAATGEVTCLHEGHEDY
ncbi:MAG: hypothetical protein WD716_02070 [Fimbriimonadaceae bacterium]